MGGAGQQGVDVVGPIADGGSFGVPTGIQRFAVELVLAAAGGQRGLFGGDRAGPAEPLQLALDLVAPLREPRQHPLRDAGDLTVTPRREDPIDAEPGRQVVADRGVVDGAGGPPRPIDGLGVERRPPPIRAPGQVGDQHVRMQLRVPGT